MDKPKWLIEDDTLYGDPHIFLDNCDFFWQNGIISQDQAQMQFFIASNDACVDALGCPSCDSYEHWHCANDIKHCKKCGLKFEIKTRRFIANSNLSIAHWWRFCYLVGEIKTHNTCLIARDLCITQKTAWHMVARLKAAMRHRGHVFKNGDIPVKDIWDCMILLMQVAPKEMETIE